VLGGANVNATTHTGTTVSVTGNITGGNVLGGANVNATTHTGATVSVTGNITGGNLSGTSIVGTLTTAAQTPTTATITRHSKHSHGALLHVRFAPDKGLNARDMTSKGCHQQGRRAVAAHEHVSVPPNPQPFPAPGPRILSLQNDNKARN
jgi:hypothetical protein